MQRKGSLVQHHVLKGMYKEKAHNVLKDTYKEKAHHMLKEIYKEKAHQTSSPTILSTAVKAVRGAVVAVGVCIHNTALSTECTTAFMTPTGECECGYECMYCCWVLQVSSLNATLRLHTGSILRSKLVSQLADVESAKLGETVSNATQCKTSCWKNHDHSSMTNSRDSMSQAHHKHLQGC